MLRLGNDMIDNMFESMHEIIDQAKTSLKEQFKSQLVSAFQHKFAKQTTKLNEQICKLEAYLSSVAPELELLRN